MGEALNEFNDYRSRMNDRIMAADNLVLKRLFNLDSNAYADGALPVKTKEMLGLVASMVLRCDDCIKYHLEKCYEEGVPQKVIFFCLAIVGIHQERTLGKGEKTDAQGQNDLLKLQMPSGNGINVRDEKIHVLIIAKQGNVQHDTED